LLLQARGSREGRRRRGSLGYHHATGQYKVVHVPCFFKTKDTLQVFTLGEASWKEVSAPGSSKCKLQTGLVSVNGTTYWVTESDGIMSFDLESEQVTFVKPLPALARATPICYLGQVQGRLSIVIATPDAGCRHSYGPGYGRMEVFTSTIYFSLHKFIV
jgi:F-box interacting protein